MGLAKDADRFPSPDYSKSLLDVYTDFARAHISTSDSFDILGEASIRCHLKQEMGKLDLPSWVPDWRVEPIPMPLSRSPSIYNASKGQELLSDLTNLLDNGNEVSEKYMLRVRGIVVDKVLLTHDIEMNNTALLILALVSGGYFTCDVLQF